VDGRPEDPEFRREAWSDLHFLYQTSPILTGSVELLADGDLLHLHDNPASNRFFGLEPGSTNGRSARSLGVPEETIRLWRGHYRQAEAESRAVRFDYQHCADGKSLWLNVTVAALGGGRFVYVAQDITERKAAEQALAHSEIRYRRIFEEAAVGIAEVDLDGRWLRVNQRLCAILGYDEPQLRTLRFQDITHPEDVDADECLAAQLRAGEIETYSLEKRYLRSDGSLVFANLTVALVRDETGAPSHFISVVEDISAARQAQERLLSAEREYRARLESEIAARTAERDRIWNVARDLMVVATPSGQFISANPAWERLLGWPTEEVVGRFAKDFMPEEDVVRLASELAALEAERPAPPCEHQYRHKDGSWRLISWVAELRDGLIYSVGRDITEERRARAALESAEAALRRISKMEAIGQLTGGIAHDFNNLLAAISGAAELIQLRADDPERVKKLAAIALEAIGRGSKLTGQLLAFSREQAVQPKPADVTALAGSLEHLLSRTLGPTIELSLANDPPVWATCDPTQLEMALINLAINARDAMPGGGRLTIATRLFHISGDQELATGDYVAIEVSDTGCGMPPDVLEKAFEPFFTTKPVGKGTGLGLSQVYGMARQARGIARVASAVGEGTTVTLLLPACEAEAVLETTPANDIAQPAPGATILVVDDDPDVRLMAATMIESLGHRVIQAANGHAALMILDHHAPDLILIDYAMPGMTGAELATAIHGRDATQRLVFVTGFSDVSAIRDAVSKPEILAKPFRIDDLAAVLRRMLPSKSRPTAPDEALGAA